MVSISYAITVHNEGAAYLEPLFQRIFKHMESEDEVVVLDDMSDEPSTVATLEKYKDRISWHKSKFDGSFADHKNDLKNLCKKDYIFFIDADENVNEPLLTTLKEILINNPDVEMYMVPRVNVVVGITPRHVSAWGWAMSDKGYINFPDYQTRIIRNLGEIEWVGVVHERLEGHKKHAVLPAFNEEGTPTEDYCLLHIKDIDRQEKQNNFYDSL